MSRDGKKNEDEKQSTSRAGLTVFFVEFQPVLLFIYHHIYHRTTNKLPLERDGIIAKMPYGLDR